MSPVVQILVLFLLFILLLKAFAKRTSKNDSNLPPSPPKLPLIGNLHQIGSLTQRSLHALSTKHGSLILLHAGQVPTLIVSSPDAARAIMKDQDHIFASRPSMKAANMLLYGSKNVGFKPYGEFWKQGKKLYILHLLGRPKVRSLQLVREGEVKVAIEKIRVAQQSSSTVDMTELLSSFTLDILCRVISRKFSKKKLLRGLIEEGTALFGEFNFEDFFPNLSWFDIFLPFYSKAKNNSKKWDNLLEEVIEEHSSSSSSNNNNNNNNGAQEKSEQNRDFVDVLLSLQRNKETEFDLTNDHIKAILMDMFGGGTHTTFITLEWAMAEVVRDPKTMRKLQREIRKIAGGKEKEIVTEEQLNEMKYLKAVIKETLRLHPPAPLLVPREAMEEGHIQGYRVPKGTKVLINAWSINRDPKYWEKAEEFYPERFVEWNLDFRGNNFEFIPFGSGRRICPGINFAMCNVEILLANILYHFDWEMPRGMERESLDMSNAPGLSERRDKPLFLVPKLPC